MDAVIEGEEKLFGSRGASGGEMKSSSSDSGSSDSYSALNSTSKGFSSSATAPTGERIVGDSAFRG